MYLFYNSMCQPHIFTAIWHDYYYGNFMCNESVWLIPGTEGDDATGLIRYSYIRRIDRN